MTWNDELHPHNLSESPERQDAVEEADWSRRVWELELEVEMLKMENAALRRELEELREWSRKRNRENREALMLLTGVDPDQGRKAGWFCYEVDVVQLAKRIKELEEENRRLSAVKSLLELICKS